MHLSTVMASFRIWGHDGICYGIDGQCDPVFDPHLAHELSHGRLHSCSSNPKVRAISRFDQAATSSLSTSVSRTVNCEDDGTADREGLVARSTKIDRPGRGPQRAPGVTTRLPV